ncbi:MAG: SufE family protein [Bdellovibrionales bacterium]|nr:SufE family protein [Bdellovibrionales bacterium]
MANPPPALTSLLSELGQIEDQDLRAELLIEYSERFVPVPETVARRPYPEVNRVPGCESEAFVFPEQRADGTYHFHFAVENPQGISARALAVILQETVSGAPLSQVQAIEDDLVFALFGTGLSMGKGLGLRNMVQCVRTIAGGTAR